MQARACTPRLKTQKASTTTKTTALKPGGYFSFFLSVFLFFFVFSFFLVPVLVLLLLFPPPCLFTFSFSSSFILITPNPQGIQSSIQTLFPVPCSPKSSHTGLQSSISTPEGNSGSCAGARMDFQNNAISSCTARQHSRLSSPVHAFQ